MKERYFHTFYFIRIVVGFFLSLALKFVFKAEFSILFIFIRWECVSPLAMQRQATMRRQISVSQRTAMETWNKIIFVVKAFFFPVIFAYIITHFANDWVNKVQKFLVRFVFSFFSFLDVVRMVFTRNFREICCLSCSLTLAPLFIWLRYFLLPIEITQSSFILFGHRTLYAWPGCLCVHRVMCALCMVIFWHGFYHSMFGEFLGVLLRIWFANPR